MRYEGYHLIALTVFDLLFQLLALAMARPRQEYLDFTSLINPDGLDIRTALWSHFFPDNVNTRSPVTFEFKVSQLSREI